MKYYLIHTLCHDELFLQNSFGLDISSIGLLQVYFKVSPELARSKSIKQKQMRYFWQTLHLNTELETENGKYLIK